MFPFLTALCMTLFVQAAPAAERDATVYGPFTAIQIDRDVVEDVLTEGDDVYVKVKQSHWSSEFRVKISNARSDSYRTWDSGEVEMAVKVYRSQQKNKLGYTYRISTAARFIEYWTDGRLILHLERTK